MNCPIFLNHKDFYRIGCITTTNIYNWLELSKRITIGNRSSMISHCHTCSLIGNRAIFALGTHDIERQVIDPQYCILAKMQTISCDWILAKIQTISCDLVDYIPFSDNTYSLNASFLVPSTYKCRKMDLYPRGVYAFTMILSF